MTSLGSRLTQNTKLQVVMVPDFSWQKGISVAFHGVARYPQMGYN